METFAEHEDFLRKKFKSYSKTPDRHINPPPSEFDYLLILDELILPEQQQHMYRKLRAKFCKQNTESHITSDVSKI